MFSNSSLNLSQKDSGVTIVTQSSIDKAIKDMNIVITGLEEKCKVKFIKEQTLDCFEYYSCNYKGYFIRIGGKVKNNYRKIVIISNRTSRLLYDGEVDKPVSHYIKLMEAFNKQRKV